MSMAGTRVFRSVPPLLPSRENVRRHMPWLDRQPVDAERPAITEQSSPHLVSYVNHDVEACRRVVIPFVNFGDAAEEHWERKSDESFIKPLATRPQERGRLVR